MSDVYSLADVGLVRLDVFEDLGSAGIVEGILQTDKRSIQMNFLCAHSHPLQRASERERDSGEIVKESERE